MIDEILAAWAHRSGMDLDVTDAGVVHGWSDMEIGYDVRRGGLGYAVNISDRGSARAVAWFTTQVDADRMLLLQLGRDWRWSHDMRPTAPAQLAPTAHLSHDSGGWSLTWPGGLALFTRPDRARLYSVVADLTLAQLAERLDEPASGL